ncbi:hypothetical protein BDW59DRAFT_163441 [Aspergillus cavernicola]|uniref:Uncharacterized protein n=1 Tax=Aspergillus cavernicola TaxID=176166 RepID=A0ABR4I6A9_9EURO
MKPIPTPPHQTPDALPPRHRDRRKFDIGTQPRTAPSPYFLRKSNPRKRLFPPHVPWGLHNGIAVLIILMIIHNNTRLIPRAISLSSPTTIVTVADFYNCSAVLTYDSNVWVRELSYNISRNLSNDTMTWLWIAVLITESNSTVDAGEFPIPLAILRRINLKRTSHLEVLINGLHVELLDIGRGCLHGNENTEVYSAHHYENNELCTYTVQGAYTRQLLQMHIIPTKLIAPFDGFSVDILRRASCEGMKSPIIRESECDKAHHQCCLEFRMSTFMKAHKKPAGLRLDEIL